MAWRVTHIRHSVLYSPINVSKHIYRAYNLKVFYEQFTQNHLSKYNRAHETCSLYLQNAFSAQFQHHAFEVHFP